jgi:hypothetical protein
MAMMVFAQCKEEYDPQIEGQSTGFLVDRRIYQ